MEDEELGARPAEATYVDGCVVAVEDRDGVVVEGER
jgi:hypothetical protein